jgi:hypothetical protein
VSIDNDDVSIEWIAPNDNGSPITGFAILIRQNDLVYSQQLSFCDGATDEIRTAVKCLVPISVLTETPYSLPWGSHVYAKIIAYNIYGDSMTSEAGFEAIILTVPNAPRFLIETISARTENSITFTWSAEAANGGAPVLDYRVSYDQASDTYIELESGVTTLAYTATVLTAGLTYKFKVEARNTYGFSALSDEVSILCATIPSVPATPTTMNVLD